MPTDELKRHLMELKGNRTWAQFARDVGTTPQTLQNLRKGVYRPRYETLLKLGIAVPDSTKPAPSSSRSVPMESDNIDTGQRKSEIGNEADPLTPQRRNGPRQAKALWEMQVLLKTDRRFVRELKEKGWPPKTAYRLIRAWERLKKFSPVVAERAAARDINMLGATDDCPYGKYYTRLVNLMPPPPMDDLGKADEWLDELEAMHKNKGRFRKENWHEHSRYTQQQRGAVAKVEDVIADTNARRDELDAEIEALQKKQIELTARRDELDAWISAWQKKLL